MTSHMRYVFMTMFIQIVVFHVTAQDPPTTLQEFAPHVSATCKAGTMNIKVKFDGAYTGAVHARDYRTSSCMAMGDGSDAIAFSLNLLAKQGSTDYCGVLVSNVSGNNRSEERSIQLAVRVHKTLELADDKFYVITCGKSGFGRDDNAHVILKFLEDERRVRETVQGREYRIRAEFTKPNGTHGIRVGNCFAFDRKNLSIPLIDERGCPTDPNIITRFIPASEGNYAEALLFSMFRFPDESEVHLQCDVIQCNGRCIDDEDCSQIALAGAGGFTKGSGGRKVGPNEEGSSIAGTTVFVVDPEKAPLISGNCEDGVRPAWLLWLTITLGVLFLIMLLMNIFLCTAMSCSCANTEIIEKDPSVVEEYDPYRSWHGSQYGSRYSLHGRDAHKGYTSGGSTIHSNRSIPIDNDHYAIVHSRSGSRHSGVQGGRARGTSSNNM
ncbi:uncharacterized protein LOC119638709 isoform X1 [Glossina fuscipes]|uniref:Uncharacterized protein LOC119638709 isoform X1 n=1 Tax=Glossina fuscipes TaxID=7396 RepID=A0A9C5Z1X5_9MUSC|nr:uncharacterized protein LOC119638709 isoform X1 [Glossina fuscipes]XP_037891582.1 uncharacterized protein LOC119638709 isoform X1 [Glossina fuscipes]XP_037891583.1 uncharacterized protein LOC119638709 isoform X1 [Glossina fuscipes]